MIVMMLCAAILLVLCFPETRIGQGAKRLFVDQPADWLNKLTLRRVIWGMVLGLIVMAALSIFPAEFALIAAGDITAYVEIIAAITMLVARVPVRRAVTWLKWQVLNLGQTVKKWGQRSRRKRSRSRLPSRSNNSDGDPEWACA